MYQSPTFETIAKWIGHASPTITSGVYGRLSQDDLNGLMRGVPFIDEGRQNNNKEQWVRIARFVTEPYVFDEEEMIGLSIGSRATTSTITKRQAMQYAAQEGITGGR